MSDTGIERIARRRGHWNPAAIARSIAVATAGSLLFFGCTGPQGRAQARPFQVTEATIAELQTALAAGSVTSRDLVAMYLARINAYDQQGPALNSISAVNSEALAEADARDAERKARRVRGPLHGIPVIVKDNYETVTMQTADGSRSLAGWVAGSDAVLVRKLRDAGAIVVAKSNMHEFARGITTLGSLFGQTRNPYMLERNPGGSSGGTGAAIAANFAAVGMGSDTCGSIRIPASHNSLAGIRGTQGLLSRTGILPLAHTQDIGGPLGRSVTDVALVLEAIAGYDPADPQTAESVGNLPKRYTESLDLNGLRGARIGLVTNFPRTAEDPAVTAVVRAALDEMRAQEADVVEATIPNWQALFPDPSDPYVVIRYEFKFDLNAYLAQHPSAPVRSLEEVLASGKVSTHETVEPRLRNSQAV